MEHPHVTTASTWAVTNTRTGTIVGCYTKVKAEQLRDEWNALAMKVRKEQPYTIIGLAVIPTTESST